MTTLLIIVARNRPAGRPRPAQGASPAERAFGMPTEFTQQAAPGIRHWRLARMSAAIHGGRWLTGELNWLARKGDVDSDWAPGELTEAFGR